MDVAVLGTDRTTESLGARCVRAGHRIRIRGEDANAVMDAVDAVERAVDADAAADLDGTTDLEAAVGAADVVVDAGDTRSTSDGTGIERMRARIADVEDLVSDETIIATGDPTLSATAVAAGLRRPGRAVGLHFVDSEGPLVEVVVADQTTSDTRERTSAFVESLGCTPIVVRDAPGFVTPRLDYALIAEAVRLVEDGVASVPAVDRSMTVGRNHPVGPLALADEIGLANVLAALDDLTERLDGRFTPPGLLREKVDSGELGTATGTGFYVWEGGEPVEPATPNPSIETRDDRPGSAER